MSGGLYLSFEMEKEGHKISINRSTYRAFRKLSPKTAVKIIREWIKDIEALDKRYPGEKDE